MRHNKLLSISIAAAMSVSALYAAPARADDDDDDVNTLRIRTVAPKASPWGELLTSVASRIKKDTGGKIKIKIYWQSKSEPAAVRQCSQGKVGGIAVSIGSLASAVPELNATELPYLFDNYAQADKAFTAATPVIKKLMADRGFILAVRGENGFRHFASKDRFLTKPGDLAGLAMRAQPSKVHQDMYSALGATPNPLQVADVPTSLQNNVVRGWDNTLLYGKLANWVTDVNDPGADGIRYVTLSGHIYQGAVVAWCKPWFDKLPADIQAALTKEDSAMETTGLKLVRAFNDKLMPSQYAKLGIKMKELSASEKSGFRSALTSVESKFIAATPSAKELLNILKANR